MTEEAKAGKPETNNALNPVPPELDSKRFLGMSTKDGELVAGEDRAAAKTAGGEKEGAKPKESKAANVSVKVKVGDDADDEESDEKTGGDKAKPRREAQKRIDQAIARQRAAERRADIAEASRIQLEARLAALEARDRSGVDKGAKDTTSDPNAPQPASYEFGELDKRYIRDLAVYETRKTIAEENARTQNTQQQKSTQEAARAHAAAVDDWASKAPAELDDFDDVVIQGAKDGLWPLSETLGRLLVESPVGHKIAYALASDPKEATRISRLPSSRQAAWFGQEEARLTAAASSGNTSGDSTKTPKVTQAPVPAQHKARGSEGANSVSPDTTDFRAFESLAMPQKN